MWYIHNADWWRLSEIDDTAVRQINTPHAELKETCCDTKESRNDKIQLFGHAVLEPVLSLESEDNMGIFLSIHRTCGLQQKKRHAMRAEGFCT